MGKGWTCAELGTGSDVGLNSAFGQDKVIGPLFGRQL